MTSILITGGSGSFGRAFTERLLKDNLYDRICIYSRDEWKQAQMRHDFNDDPRLRFFIGCVRDRDRLRRAMEGVEVVIHAAALKRIEVGQYNPGEMVKTNVLGAINIIEAAHDANVNKVIGLSTDKAFQPISPYGHSKAISEQLFLAANEMSGTNGPKFSVTRYGNVAGSTGSVIPTWRKILGRRGIGDIIPKVPVTDPECTRFYMTMDQAVELVLATIETMPETPVIPSLPAYRLGDLAEAMGAQMEIKGLPAHEKLAECMCEGNCSDTARRMSVEELKEALKDV